MPIVYESDNIRFRGNGILISSGFLEVGLIPKQNHAML